MTTACRIDRLTERLDAQRIAAMEPLQWRFAEDYDVAHVRIYASDERMRQIDDLVELVEEHNLAWPGAPVPLHLRRKCERFARTLGTKLRIPPQSIYNHGPGSLLHEALLDLAGEIQPGSVELDG